MSANTLEKTLQKERMKMILSERKRKILLAVVEDYIQDAALGLINIEQNEIVKIFSVAAVIFMPATLIASIYGMNFKFMPELDWTLTLGNGWNIPLGYIFAIGLMIFCSALTIWYFKYKKWL